MYQYMNDVFKFLGAGVTLYGGAYVLALIGVPPVVAILGLIAVGAFVFG